MGWDGVSNGSSIFFMLYAYKNKVNSNLYICNNKLWPTFSWVSKSDVKLGVGNILRSAGRVPVLNLGAGAGAGACLKVPLPVPVPVSMVPVPVPVPVPVLVCFLKLVPVSVWIVLLPMPVPVPVWFWNWFRSLFESFHCQCRLPYLFDFEAGYGAWLKGASAAAGANLIVNCWGACFTRAGAGSAAVLVLKLVLVPIRLAAVPLQVPVPVYIIVEGAPVLFC